MILKLSITISGDATEMYVTDDSTGWGQSGEPSKNEVIAPTGFTIEDKDGILIPSPIPFQLPAYDMIDGTVTITPALLGLGTDTIPDGVYLYTYNVVTATFDETVTDQEFVIYRTVQQNIHKDLMVELNRAKSYNCEPDYEVLKELRRRSNLLYGIVTAEFFAETDNIENLLNYLQILEK